MLISALGPGVGVSPLIGAEVEDVPVCALYSTQSIAYPPLDPVETEFANVHPAPGVGVTYGRASMKAKQEANSKVVQMILPRKAIFA
jgi:hypothetical protein